MVRNNKHLKYLDNIHQGERVVLFMPGHSLNDFQFISDFDGCYLVGMNTTIFSKILKDITLNYFFIQDPGRSWGKFEYNNSQTVYDNYKCINDKFYSCHYPSFNFYGSGALPFNAYSGKIYSDAWSSYEDFEDMENNPFVKDVSEAFPYTNAGVAFTVMQFLLYMGFDTIYLVGSDITGCYFYENDDSITKWNTTQIRLKDRWEYFKRWMAVEYPDVEVVTINPTETSKGLFADYYLPDKNLNLPSEVRKNKSKVHLVSIPYSITNKDYSCCAFTQNILKFIDMMKNDCEMLHYGHSLSDVSCENVEVTNEKDFELSFGKDWQTYFKTGWFKYGDKNKHLPIYEIFEERVVVELAKRLSYGDKILFWWGSGHINIYDCFVDKREKYALVEPAIGYPQVLEKTFKAYASHTAMASHLGKIDSDFVDWNQRVIPHYFDLDDFEFSVKTEDYFVFLHRITYAKGFDLVLQLARDLGFNLKVAGQGSLEDYDIPDNVEYLGSVGVEERKKLLSKSKGMLMPTMYLEPFGMSGVEALLSGTPTITTDFGAFSEWNLHGLTGYRCKRYDEFVWAINNIDKIDRNFCREWAVNKYSFDSIRPLYIDFFEFIDDVYHDKGIYKNRKIKNLDNELFFGKMNTELEVS